MAENAADEYLTGVYMSAAIPRKNEDKPYYPPPGWTPVFFETREFGTTVWLQKHGVRTDHD